MGCDPRAMVVVLTLGHSVADSDWTLPPGDIMCQTQHPLAVKVVAAPFDRLRANGNW
jgi:hypothetical protein